MQSLKLSHTEREKKREGGGRTIFKATIWQPDGKPASRPHLPPPPHQSKAAKPQSSGCLKSAPPAPPCASSSRGAMVLGASADAAALWRLNCWGPWAKGTQRVEGARPWPSPSTASWTWSSERTERTEESVEPQRHAVEPLDGGVRVKRSVRRRGRSGGDRRGETGQVTCPGLFFIQMSSLLCLWFLPVQLFLNIYSPCFCTRLFYRLRFLYLLSH